MRLFDAAQSQDALPGTWFPHSPGVEAEIRAITPDEEGAIERRYGIRKWRGTKGGPEVDVNHDKAESTIRERFLLALINTKGAETRMLDDASAEIYGRLLGLSLKKGDLAKLDDKWSPELKRQVVKDAPDFAQWVSRKSRGLREVAADDEEGKDES